MALDCVVFTKNVILHNSFPTIDFYQNWANYVQHKVTMAFPFHYMS